MDGKFDSLPAFAAIVTLVAILAGVLVLVLKARKK
jgi:hypothetical protein